MLPDLSHAREVLTRLTKAALANKPKQALLLSFLFEAAYRENQDPYDAEGLARDCVGLTTNESSTKTKEAQARKTMDDLRATVEAYYAVRGKDDDIQFTFPPSGKKNYRLIIQHRREAILCTRVGDDSKGLRELASKMAGDFGLVKLRDTHVRTGRHVAKYMPQDLEAFGRALATFLQRDDQHAVEILTGHSPDPGYVQRIQQAVGNRSNQVTIRQLRNPGPVMNFSLLTFKKDNRESREVLFGWGRHDPGTPESVFHSDDRRLVREFEQLYDRLAQQYGDPKSVGELFDLPHVLTPLELLDLERQAPRSSTIWIVAPTLAEIDEIKPSSEDSHIRVREAVQANAANEVTYHYFFPETTDPFLTAQLRAQFQKHPDKIKTHPLPEDTLRQIGVLPMQFICLSAPDQNQVFMQQPIEPARKDWLRVQPASAKLLLVMLQTLSDAADASNSAKA